jgi:hypothetical protein
VGVVIDDEDADVSLLRRVVAFVAGEREVIEVRPIAGGGVVVVIADGGEEVVDGVGRARAVAAGVRIDELVVPLPDVVVDGVGAAVGIVVVADGGDGVGVPALDQVGHIARRRDLHIGGIVPDDRQAGQQPARFQRFDHSGARRDLPATSSPHSSLHRPGPGEGHIVPSPSWRRLPP